MTGAHEPTPFRGAHKLLITIILLVSRKLTDLDNRLVKSNKRVQRSLALQHTKSAYIIAITEAARRPVSMKMGAFVAAVSEAFSWAMMAGAALVRAGRVSCMSYHYMYIQQYDQMILCLCVQQPYIFCCSLYLLLSPDINECSTSNGGCEQSCSNSQGSFSCSCRSGFSLDSNGRTCSGELYRYASSPVPVIAVVDITAWSLECLNTFASCRQ